MCLKLLVFKIFFFKMRHLLVMAAWYCAVRFFSLTSWVSLGSSKWLSWAVRNGSFSSVDSCRCQGNNEVEMCLISPPKNVRIWPLIAFEEFSQTSSKSSDIDGILSWEKSSGSSGWYGLNLGLISWQWSELIGFEWRRNVRLFLLLLQLQKMAPSLDFNGSCSRPRHEVNSCCGLTQN